MTMSTMKALIVQGSEPVLKNSYPVPARKKGEALIRVRRSGVCNTDLEIFKGYMGFQGVVGHEFVGEIAEVGADVKMKVGQRVVGEINATCGSCEYCHFGGILKRNHCKERGVLGIKAKDGCHAEFLILPVDNLFPVPDSISDEEACFVEPLAAAFRIIEQGLIKADDKVALIGDGKLGQLIAQVIQTQQTKRFVVFGKHSEKLDALGASQETVIVNDTSAETFQDVFDVVVDACGHPSGLTLAQTLTRPLGTIVLKTTCAAGPAFNTAPYVVKELTIVGSRCGNFPMALESLEKGTVKVKHLLQKTYPMTQALEAIAEAGRKGTLKVQINMCS